MQHRAPLSRWLESKPFRYPLATADGPRHLAVSGFQLPQARNRVYSPLSLGFPLTMNVPRSANLGAAEKQFHCQFDGGTFLAPWLLSPQLDVHSHASDLQLPAYEASTRAYDAPCINWPPRSVSLEGKLSISNGSRIGCLYIRASTARASTVSGFCNPCCREQLARVAGKQWFLHGGNPPALLFLAHFFFRFPLHPTTHPPPPTTSSHVRSRLDDDAPGEYLPELRTTAVQVSSYLHPYPRARFNANTYLIYSTQDTPRLHSILGS